MAQEAKKTYIIWDQRAASGSTDDAVVLDTAETLEEALQVAEDENGVAFSYDVSDDGKTLQNGEGPLHR
jgi:hypothetical protein